MASLDRQTCSPKIKSWFPRPEPWGSPVFQASLDGAFIFRGLCLVMILSDLILSDLILSDMLDDTGDDDPGDPQRDPALPSRYVFPRPRPNTALLIHAPLLTFPARQLSGLPRVPMNRSIALLQSAETTPTTRATSGTTRRQKPLPVANTGQQTPRPHPRPNGNASKESLSQQTSPRRIPRAIKARPTHLELRILLFASQTSTNYHIIALRWPRTTTRQSDPPGNPQRQLCRNAMMGCRSSMPLSRLRMRTNFPTCRVPTPPLATLTATTMGSHLQLRKR